VVKNQAQELEDWKVLKDTGDQDNKVQYQAYENQIKEISDSLGVVMVEKIQLTDDNLSLKTQKAELMNERNKWQVMYEELEPEAVRLQCLVDELQANDSPKNGAADLELEN